MARAHVVLLAALAFGCSHPSSGGGGGGSSATGGGGSATGGGSAAGGGAATGGGGSATGGGTGTGGGGSFTGDGGSYSCDVESIVQSRCLDCHSSPPRFGAPMSLETYADTQANSAQYPGQKIYQRMAFRVADDASPMPQVPNARLTADQITTMQNWAASGAQPGSCSYDAGTIEGYDGGTAACPTGSSAIDFTAPQFAIPQATDFYQCFAFTVSLPQGEDLIQVDKIIDNAQVLHHIVVFRDTNKSSPMSQGSCGFKASWQVLYAWAPGTGPFTPPQDIGIPVANGDQIVIQYHYNNPTMITGNDSSGVRLCATPTMRPKQAGVMAIGPTSFNIPPNCSQASISGDSLNPQFLNKSYDVFTQWPHMHLRGRAQKTVLHHSGTDTVVEDRPNYSFGAQYLEPASFTFAPGDSLTLTCTWDTTGASGMVKWGEGTGDEMCFNFLYMTPPPPVAIDPSTGTTTPTCVP